MNWFSSYVFKADWFASRWWTHVTVPVVTHPGVGGGGSAWIMRPKMYDVELPNLFDGSKIGRDMPMITEDFWADDIFAVSPTPAIAPLNPRQKPRFRKPGLLKAHPFKRKIRDLDSGVTLKPSKPGRLSECALCRYPAKLRDIYGDFTVLAVYCNRRDSTGAVVVRHLG